LKPGPFKLKLWVRWIQLVQPPTTALSAAMASRSAARSAALWHPRTARSYRAAAPAPAPAPAAPAAGQGGNFSRHFAVKTPNDCKQVISLYGWHHFSPSYFAVKTPNDDSQHDGPCNQSNSRELTTQPCRRVREVERRLRGDGAPDGGHHPQALEREHVQRAARGRIHHPHGGGGGGGGSGGGVCMMR
jgi:hypothetical protein